jgi:hypothetical protein
MNPDDPTITTFTDGDLHLVDGIPVVIGHPGPSTLTLNAYGTSLVFYEEGTQEVDPAAALTFHPDGRIHRHGTLIGNDAEIVAGLREFVFACRR